MKCFRFKRASFIAEVGSNSCMHHSENRISVMVSWCKYVCFKRMMNKVFSSNVVCHAIFCYWIFSTAQNFSSVCLICFIVKKNVCQWHKLCDMIDLYSVVICHSEVDAFIVYAVVIWLTQQSLGKSVLARSLSLLWVRDLYIYLFIYLFIIHLVHSTHKNTGKNTHKNRERNL